MDPVVSVQTLLLRAQLPELALRPGAAVVARVASRGEAHAVLVLAGIPLTARLPEGIETGATLRLVVDEVGPERVVLRLDPEAALPPPAERPAAPRIAVREPPSRRGGAGGDEASVALTFESPALGRLDLRIDLATGSLRAGVAAADGEPFRLADAGGERLRASLEDATGLRSSVRVTARREPLDLYA